MDELNTIDDFQAVEESSDTMVALHVFSFGPSLRFLRGERLLLLMTSLDVFENLDGNRLFCGTCDTLCLVKWRKSWDREGITEKKIDTLIFCAYREQNGWQPVKTPTFNQWLHPLMISILYAKLGEPNVPGNSRMGCLDALEVIQLAPPVGLEELSIPLAALRRSSSDPEFAIRNEGSIIVRWALRKQIKVNELKCPND